jgi:tetratricopeptide (TPR) repeat protein
MGRYAEALEHYEAARSLIDCESLAVEQKQHQAELCRKTANVHQRLGEYDVAREWLVKGLEYLSETTIETACIYTLLAGIYHRQGNNNEALRNCHKSVNIASEVNSREGLQCVARAYYILGAVYWRSNQYSDAEQYCRKSLQIYQKIGDIPGQARAYNNLAIIFYEQASWSQAREIYYKSLAINEKIGNIQEQGFVLNNLAEIHLDQGQLDQALDLYQRSNTIWEQIGFALPEAVTLSNLAQVYLLQGELLKARECLLNSQAIFAEINCEDYLAELERRWGEYYLKTGDLDKALDHTRRSHELAVSQADRREEGISSRMLGEVHLARGEYQSAKIILGESLKIMQELGNDYETAKTMMSLIQLEMADETKEPSRDHLEQATQVFTRYGAQIDLERALTLANRLNQ